MTFHEGEREIQAQAGVQIMAQRVGRGIHPTIPPAAEGFLLEQIMAVAGTVDREGNVWASLLSGEPGFLNPLDEHTLLIEATPAAGDPLLDNLASNPNIGLVAITFADRQRVRVNGTAEVHPDGICVNVRQAYANCQKYIQARVPREVSRGESEPQKSSILTPSQQQMISHSDTFFIASYHPEGGADASHRGGNPGFVRVVNTSLLEFPDYSGNMMFNTLGNMAINPQVGLLFIDFERGTTLQLSGQAEIIWDAEQVAQFPAAERLIRFSVGQVIETINAIPYRFDFLHYSPFNAPVMK